MIGDALASTATAELTDLCQTVVDVLEDAYVGWGGTGEPDVFWSDETTAEEPPEED